MSQIAPTVAQLIEQLPITPDQSRSLGSLNALGLPLLSPIDLQCVKACGVTFALSAIERVIEKRARGDASTASAIRDRLEERVGGSIRAVIPGSADAAALAKGWRI